MKNALSLPRMLESGVLSHFTVENEPIGPRPPIGVKISGVPKGPNIIIRR